MLGPEFHQHRVAIYAFKMAARRRLEYINQRKMRIEEIYRIKSNIKYSHKVKRIVWMALKNNSVHLRNRETHWYNVDDWLSIHCTMLTWT